MSKKLKFSASFVVVVLSLILGITAFAEDSTTNTGTQVACPLDAKLCPDGTSVSRTGPSCEFALCPGVKNNRGEEIKNRIQEVKNQISAKKEQNQTERENLKSEVRVIRDEIANKREEIKSNIQGLVQSIKTNREETKAELVANREQVKAKITEIRNNFKENLTNIKNEDKKQSAEKIVDTILGLNTKIIDSLSSKTDQIENVLVSIESRATKAGDAGMDVTVVNTQIEQAKTAIATAREAISTQSKKVYEINTVTDEATLKIEMKALRDTFTKDIKDLRVQVTLAHTAVKNAADILAKIPKIDEIVVTNNVEDTNPVTN